jgi:hypothetical protein
MSDVSVKRGTKLTYPNRVLTNTTMKEEVQMKGSVPALSICRPLPNSYATHKQANCHPDQVQQAKEGPKGQQQQHKQEHVSPIKEVQSDSVVESEDILHSCSFRLHAVKSSKITGKRTRARPVMFLNLRPASALAESPRFRPIALSSGHISPRAIGKCDEGVVSCIVSGTCNGGSGADAVNWMMAKEADVQCDITTIIRSADSKINGPLPNLSSSSDPRHKPTSQQRPRAELPKQVRAAVGTVGSVAQMKRLHSTPFHTTLRCSDGIQNNMQRRVSRKHVKPGKGGKRRIDGTSHREALWHSHEAMLAARCA